MDILYKYFLSRYLENFYDYQSPPIYFFSCQNGADCNNINGSCNCPPGFLGKDCSQTVSRIKYDSCLMSYPLHISVLPNAYISAQVANLKFFYNLEFDFSLDSLKKTFSTHVFDKFKMFINPSHVLLLVPDRKVWTKLLPELYLSAEL